MISSSESSKPSRVQTQSKDEKLRQEKLKALMANKGVIVPSVKNGDTFLRNEKVCADARMYDRKRNGRKSRKNEKVPEVNEQEKEQETETIHHKTLEGHSGDFEEKTRLYHDPFTHLCEFVVESSCNPETERGTHSSSPPPRSKPGSQIPSVSSIKERAYSFSSEPGNQRTRIPLSASRSVPRTQTLPTRRVKTRYSPQTPKQVAAALSRASRVQESNMHYREEKAYKKDARDQERKKTNKKRGDDY